MVKVQSDIIFYSRKIISEKAERFYLKNYSCKARSDKTKSISQTAKVSQLTAMPYPVFHKRYNKLYSTKQIKSSSKVIFQIVMLKSLGKVAFKLNIRVGYQNQLSNPPVKVALQGRL